MENKKIVLIDGHSILNRAFYGVPDLTNGEGLHTNAVYGFLNIMFKILDEEKADYLAVAFDLKAPTFRHKMYPEYKGTRKPMPDELRQQVPVMKEMLSAMGIPLMMLEGYEADDILGTVSRQMEEKGLEVSVISGDRDLLQLASEQVCIRIPKTKRNKTEIEDYHAADVVEHYQVTPHQIIELKALMGDTSDNIPGIPGVGEKTAAKIIAEFGCIEHAYEHVEEVKPNKARLSLQEHYDLAVLSKKLATIDRNVPFELNLEEAGASDLYTPQALELCKRLEFKNMLQRFSSAADTDDQKAVFEEITDPKQAEQFFKAAANEKCVGLQILFGEQKTEAAEVQMTMEEWMGKLLNGTKPEEKEQSQAKQLISLAVSARDGLTVYMKVSDKLSEAFLTAGLAELCTSSAMIACEGLKEQLPVIYPAVFPETLSFEEQEKREQKFFDNVIGAYLLNPLKNQYAYDDLLKDYTGRMCPSREELLGRMKIEDAIEQKPEQLKELICWQAYTAVETAGRIEEQLRQTGMKKLFDEIEMPLVYVLYRMEQTGIRVASDELKTYGDTLGVRIREMESRIYEQAGEVFNINSPKQLGVILFEKLQMPYGKKTKTGYSTAADVLEKLALDYPLVASILEYRQLTKLKSTYADGLAAFISQDGRIHGKFHQTITATGRISSTDPNLQNIPVRTALGRELRKVFIPENGYVFVDADYSQIELRVLAHVSGDEQLIDAYKQAKDIHAITASQVFHVPLDQVTALERRNAKAVNFGIVYGISSFGLSQDLSITRKEAQEYIEQYFATYPAIKQFLDNAVKNAKETGYAETLFGRRRPVPELSSGNFMQRSFGERVAMNSPIQGTAADIIKAAMIRVDESLRKQKLKSRLILQVHDELLIETYAGETEQVKAILAAEMTGAADLKVPMEVDMNVGENWYDAH